MGQASSRQTKDLVPSSRKTKELTAVDQSFSRSVAQKHWPLSVSQYRWIPLPLRGAQGQRHHDLS